MSGRSPNKRGRKKKSNKGRKPKKPLSKEEIAAKKNQKNMRETCRRVEINLHYELLYHSLGQNLVYNRAERVQLLRKAIIKMAELKSQVTSLTDQIRATGMTPHEAPTFQLNHSQKLFMLVQRWARNDNGKKCSRAKLKPVGIEIIDDNALVPITVPCDGRIISEQLGNEENDHIPFWASWETDTYIVVDQDAFEKACSQAIIAGWDGKLGSTGAYYRRGLPQTCGLTIATSVNNLHNNSNNKYNDDDCDDSDDDDLNINTNNNILNGVINNHNHGGYHRIQAIHDMNIHNLNNNISMPVFPPRVDFPEIVVQNDMDIGTNRSSDSVNTSSEPPIKKQKLNNGTTKNKNKIYNQFNINNSQFIQQSLPLSVPFPAVSAMITNPIHPMSTLNNTLNGTLNASPFMNIGMNNNDSNTPDHPGQSTSSDTGSQHSLSKYVKSEPNDSTPPQRRVQLPQFLGGNNTFPPIPSSQQYQLVNGTYPIYPHPIINQLQQQGICDTSNNSTPNMIIERENKDNVIIKQSPSNRSKCSNNNTNSDDINGICTNISTINNDNKENKLHTHTPPPNKLNDLSPGGSRTSHETRNSVVFTPANHKNSSAISTNSNTPPNKSPRPTPHKPSIHLPDNTSIDNYVNQLNWNNNNQSDEYNNNYDVITSIGINPMNNMINEIAVNGYQDGNANNVNVDDGNGMKGSVFYG